jgi:ABC-type sulfate transport system substrate-binding protein
MSFSQPIEGRLFAGGNIDAKKRRKSTGADIVFAGAPKAQAIGAKTKYRPRKPESDPGDLAHFVKIDLLTLDHDFGSWEKAQGKFAPKRRFDRSTPRVPRKGVRPAAGLDCQT